MDPKMESLPNAVAMDGDGDFVVAWQSTGQDGSGNGIYAQRYNTMGVVQGSEFKVNTTVVDNQLNPSVAMDGAGNHVIAWQSRGQDGSSYGIYAQLYDASGVAQGGEIPVNTCTTSIQARASIAMDQDGDFIIARESANQDGSSYGVYAQRYNVSGIAQVPEFRVNTYTNNRQDRSSIAMDSDGDFVIAWRSGGQDGSSYGIYAQRYNKSGVVKGPEFRVNTQTANNQLNPSIALDSDGDFVITWGSIQDGSSFGVYAQRYNAGGVAQGEEFQVNTYTSGSQAGPFIAMDDSGDFVITWQSFGQDGFYDGIYAQQYAGPPPCDTPPNPTSFNVMDNSADLNWYGTTTTLSYDVKYRVTAGTWTTENTLTNSLGLSGLQAGTTYEWKVNSLCSVDGSNSSTFTTSQTFETTGGITCP